MKEAIADRRKSKTEGSLLIDKLIGSGNSEAAIVADAITYFVAGFHTTGLSKCNHISYRQTDDTSFFFFLLFLFAQFRVYSSSIESGVVGYITKSDYISLYWTELYIFIEGNCKTQIH